MAQQDEDRPVRDDGLAPRETPFFRGQKYQGDLSTRKKALLDGGPGLGHIPGHGGTLRGSSLHAGGVQEATAGREAPANIGGGPRTSTGRRPMPREIPVHTQSTHFGNVTRYLDGHSEVHYERPELVREMTHPDTHPEDAEALRQEIAHRDAVHTHRYW
jgi:hypothetical protein